MALAAKRDSFVFYCSLAELERRGRFISIFGAGRHQNCPLGSPPLAKCFNPLRNPAHSQFYCNLRKTHLRARDPQLS